MRKTYTVVVGDFWITGDVWFDWIDDSFDHAFGTEHCGHFEPIDAIIKSAMDDNGNDVKIETLSQDMKEQAEELLKQEGL